MHASLLAFTAYRQFIIYRLVPSTSRPGKTDKLPCDWRTGKVVSAHDPSYWTDAATAEAVAAQWGESWGIGFVFTDQDPFWFLDIDNCKISDAHWSPLALGLCGALPGCAIEISGSGAGLHIFGSGALPPHGCKNAALGLELYHTGRFVALTGFAAMGDAGTNMSHIMPAIVTTYFPPDAVVQPSEWTTGPDADWRGPADDLELVRRAMASQSANAAFSNKASFADLWLCNESALALSYPDGFGGGRPYDESVADAALAQHLAFWTGRDCERMLRIMWESKLARDKWHREDYLPRTILRAVSLQIDVLKDNPPAIAFEPSVILGNSETESISGDGFMSCEQQQIYFKGCIYVRSLNKAFVPGGILLKPEQFRVIYAGYQFNLDASNRKVTKDAWEAWSQSHAYKRPVVDGTTFKPQLPPGQIIYISGQSFVNIYFPVPIARKQGDPKPFLDHLAKVLPDSRDATVLLSYMAACVQHQGTKFQWAPLLQGVEGNGKTLFARCIAEAVGRRYVHWPKASKLAKEFNAWMIGKVFFAVEDIYVPDARREIIEELKPMITGGDGLEIEAKGVDQISLDICGNFFFNSNHIDAIKKTKNDRRFCILFCAQQAVEDLATSGMDGSYFTSLYDWLHGEGYAIISEFLWTYPIPAEFNPAGDCQRAPVTSSTVQALEAGLGNVEQEVMECVAQGVQGFAGGWISTTYFDRMLDRMGLAKKISHHRRKQILESLGYVHHPAMPGGRVNALVMPDGTKPRLFVLKNSAAASSLDPIKSYEAANTHNVVGTPWR